MRRRWATLWLGGLTLASAAPLWLFRYVPMTDAPNHLLAAFIAVHYTDPRFSFARYFTLDLTPRSNILGHYLMMLGLGLGLRPEDVLRVLATGIVLATVWALYALLRVARGEAQARLWFPLGIPLAYSWFFHQGFLNFTLSVPLALLTVAVAHQAGLWGTPHPVVRPAGRARWGYLALVMGLLYLTYLAHALGLALALLAGGVLTLVSLATSGAPLRERARAACRAAAPVLGVALVVWLTGRLNPNARGEASMFLTPPFVVWVPLSKKLAELRYGLLSFAPWREQLILLPAAALAVGGWLVGLRRPTPWHLATLAALALYFALPMGFWVPFFIYERFWLFAWLLAVVALPAWRAVPWRRVVQGSLTLVALAFLLNVANSYRIANRDLRDYATVLKALPDGTWAFPFTYHRQGRISPGRHFWAYAMMTSDVFIPMVFAEVYHPVQYRPTVNRPVPLRYEDGFFAEHARNRATLWVREDDPLMQAVVVPKLPRHGYRPAGRVGPYRVYRLTRWPPPVPPEARPHITPDVAAAYEVLLVFGVPPRDLEVEIQRYYRLAKRVGWARLYRRFGYAGPPRRFSQSIWGTNDAQGGRP